MSAPEMIDVMVSVAGDMSMCSDGSPLNGGPECTHLPYLRADTVEARLAAAEAMAEALEELRDLMNAVYEHEYDPDSFTTQPADAALAQWDAVKGGE